MMKDVDFFQILVEQAPWQNEHSDLVAIRRKVFVEEQHVPEELEVDKHDPAARHWLAYDGNHHAIGTARLVGNQIGRMAVLKEFRNKGVGATLVRKIFYYARQNNINELIVHAQLHAVPFYENLGFSVNGEEFMDAGIPHLPMTINLAKFVHPVDTEKLPEITQEQRQHVHLENLQDFLRYTNKFAESTERNIRIFSNNLNPAMYNNESLSRLVHALATKHPNSTIRILLRDNQLIRTQHIALAELTIKLSSHVFLRQLDKETKCLHNDFLIFDKTAIIYQQEQQRFIGYAVEYAPLEALDLAEEFDEMWEHSRPDPEARRLHI